MSHGGCSNKLLTTNDFIKLQLIFNSDDIDRLSYSGQKMKGGFFGHTDNKLTKDHITNKLDSINSIVHNAMMNAVVDQEKPNKDTAFILAISAGFDSKVNLGREKLKSNELSPIMPGYEYIRNNFTLCEECTVVQIIGHMPAGFAPVVDYFESKDGKRSGFLINLDTSQSFTAKGTNSGSINYVSVDEGNIKVKGNIKFNINVKPQEFKTKRSLYTNNNYVKLGQEVVTSAGQTIDNIDYEQDIGELGSAIKSNNYLHSKDIHVLYVGEDKVMVVLKALNPKFKIPDSFARTLLIVDKNTLETRLNKKS